MTLPVICLMGPTASGKTNAAIRLVQDYNCEIISVDSALIYRGMDIGTAKPTEAEQLLAHHHLIDILEPTEIWSAAEFVSEASRLIGEIHQRNRIPLLTGGTMMYFNALINGIASELPEATPELRADLEALLANDGLEALQQRLLSQNPTAREHVDIINPQRLIRAIEVIETTGKPIQEHWADQSRPAHPWPLIQIGLTHKDRSVLHQRIKQRFHIMLEQGFEQEVRKLMQIPGMHVDLPSMRSVGYRQMWHYIEGRDNKQDMIDKGIAATRQLAKRQLTWMRRWPGLATVDFMHQDPASEIIQIVKSLSSTC